MKAAAAELDFERAARLRDDIGALERVLEKSAVVLPRRHRRRRVRPRRGRARGRGAALPRARRPGARPARLGGRARRRDHARASSSTCSSRSTAARPGDAVPREVLVPVLPDDADALSLWLSGLRGSRVDLRVPPRRQAHPDGDRRPQRQAEPGPAQGDPGRRPHHPQPGAPAAAGHPRARRGAAAHRVLRHQPRAGHPGRRVDGRLRGRAAAQVRVPPLHRARRRDRRPPTTPRRCTRCSPAGSAAASARRPSVARAGCRRRGCRRRRHPRSGHDPRGSPTGPTSSSSTAGCRRSTPPPGRSRTAGSSTSPWSGSPSGSRRCGCRGRSTPSCCRARARASTCCSGCATRRTASRSPSTASARSKAMTTSRLDGIPGLGEKRRKALLKQFGSVKRIRAASVDELADVPGIGPALAAVVAARVGLDRRHHARGQPRHRRGRRRRRSRPCRWSGQWLTTSPVPRRRRCRRCRGRPTSSSSPG